MNAFLQKTADILFRQQLCTIVIINAKIVIAIDSIYDYHYNKKIYAKKMYAREGENEYGEKVQRFNNGR